MADHQDPELLQAELRARVGRAHDPYDEAVWRLLLGEADAGLATIRRRLPDLVASTQANLHLAQIAVLADDPGAPGIAASAVDATMARFVPGDRDYHATLLAVMAGEEDLARSHLARLEVFVATHDKLRGGQPSGIADIPRGLIDRDGHLLTAGVEALLAWHLRRARSRSEVFNSSRGVISFDSIVALILGHRRGLTATVRATYRAAQVPMLATHLTEWQGRPLPRAMPIGVVTDLVAGPWLRAHGLAIDAASPLPPARTPGSRRTPGTSVASLPAEQAEARQRLEARMRLGGHYWQLASWAVMLGDIAGARARLRAAAADSRQRWHASVPGGGASSRRFVKDLAMPNPNLVREHLALALVLGDEGGLRESGDALQGWLKTQEGKGWPIYGHTEGYLDLICDLVGSRERSNPSRHAVEQVTGPLPSTRVAAIALAERNARLFREGMEAMLNEHATTLEHRTSPPPPICAPAVQLAAAARRLAMPIEVDERFARWPVAVEGARVPVDLLGLALWSSPA